MSRKLLEFVQEFCKETQSERAHLRLQCRSCKQHPLERRDVWVKGTALRMRCSSPATNLTVASRLSVALKAGHIAETLGEREARYPERVLWLKGALDDPDKSAARLLECGYNSLIISAKQLEGTKLESLQDWGIRVFVEVEGDSESTALGAVDGVCYVAKQPILDTEKTRADRILEELHSIEERYPDSQILFFLSMRDLDVEAWERVLDDASARTSVLFAAVGSEGTEEAQGLHPLWEHLRRSPDYSATPLLPVVNAGALASGEGFWPTVPLDLYESVLPRMQHEAFVGAVALAKSLPRMGSFLEGSLWTLGQALWTGESPLLLFESWMDAHGHAKELLPLLREVRSLVNAIMGLDALEKVSASTAPEAENYRLLAEGLIARLNVLRESAGLSPYIAPFIADAKRLVLRFLQRQQLVVAHILSGQDMSGGFWTRIEGDAKQGFKGASEVELLSEPDRGNDGDPQRKIAEEVLGCHLGAPETPALQP